jgi:hypothetical protein
MGLSPAEAVFANRRMARKLSGSSAFGIRKKEEGTASRAPSQYVSVFS